MPVRGGACLVAVSLMWASVAALLLRCCWLVSAGDCVYPEEAGPAAGAVLHVPQGWAQSKRWAVRDDLAGAKILVSQCPESDWGPAIARGVASCAA